MKKVFRHCIVYHFADDTSVLYANKDMLLHANKDMTTIENIRNIELKKLVNWLRATKLFFNQSKTQHFFVSYDNFVILLIISNLTSCSFLLNQFLT